MNSIKLPIAVLVLSAFALPVLAQENRVPSGERIDQRQTQQQQLIDQGIASGRITAREAAELKKGQERVQAMEDQAKAGDGRMSRTERTGITQEQDRQGRNIDRDMRNKEFTPVATTDWDERQARQSARIDQGVAAGTITAQEAAKLHRGQVRVQRLETRAKSDGTVTVAERASIKTEQDRQSQAIRTAVRDNQFDR
jgi:hypothetical protein